MNRNTLVLLLTAALLLALLPTLAVAEPPPQRASVQPQVWGTLEAEEEAEILVVLKDQADLSAANALPSKEAKGRYVYETLRALAEETQQELRKTLDAQGVDYQSFYIVNAIRVQADGALVKSLAARSDVDRIALNPWVKGIPDEQPTQQPDATAPLEVEGNISRVNADDVWALGYTGQGVIVAGQDTGYDWQHPALINQYRGWDGATASHDYNWHDAIHSGGGVCGPNSPEPCDDGSHGTHTMGTLVGDDGDTHQIGMAPGAEWIGCRNMNQGYGTPATYMECFEFFLAPYPLGGAPTDGDSDLAPHVISNSWSCPDSEGCDADSLEATVEAVRQAGIVVVVSAGNYGSACETVHYPPALYQQSFTVGGFNHRDDVVYSSSSRGPVTYGGETYIKPDISAPAVSVNSCVPNGSYSQKTGTSMAAPHVAGAVALLLSAAPGYSGQVDTIEQVLTSTATPRTTTQECGGDGPTDVPNNVWGWGMLDALAAVEWATSGTLQGTVTDAETSTPIESAAVSVKLPTGFDGPQTLTTSAGQYSLALAPGTYDVIATAEGYASKMMTGVVIAGDEITNLDFEMAFHLTALPLVLKNW